jgi:peptidoglycan-associated lipoprotein
MTAATHEQGGIMRKWLVASFVLALLVGCASTQPQTGAPVEDRTPGAGTPGAPGASTSGATPPGVTGTPSGRPGDTSVLRDPRNILSRRTILFDYDSSTVREEYRELVNAHAKYLQANRGARLTLQGHTDERGSREYNIALGQRRSDAVKNLMQLLGGGEGQIETVSFGKEKPKSEGHDESAWAQNRRVEIIYAGE